MGIGALGMRFWQRRYAPHPDSADLRRAATWTKMAQRISHDMKSPLAGMLLTIQQMQREYQKRTPGASEHYDPFVHQITDRIEHLRRMSRDFMKFVDTEKPHFIATDFNAFIQEHCTTIEQNLPPDITLTVNLGSDLPPVELDQEQMHSVFDNLVSNSINAMPDGGQITMVTDVARDLQFSSQEKTPQDYVTLEVRDIGSGIAQEHLTKLFDAGFTTAEHGTGLGLVLVHKIVADHHGHIEIESEEGKGTIVTIYLPVGSK